MSAYRLTGVCWTQRDAKVDKARDIERKLKEARVQLEQEKERADKLREQVKEVRPCAASTPFSATPPLHTRQ